MERLKLVMVRAYMDNVPEAVFPEGFSVRYFHEGDENLWARVEASVGEFASREDARAHLEAEFGDEMDAFEERCLFLENAAGEVIGTATAWKGVLSGESKEIGRIHWIAIMPEYQGYGLAKPLLSEAMHVIGKYHDRVYLTSQTTSYQAINLYLNYGFAPVVASAEDVRAWRLMEDVLKRKVLVE